MFAWPPCPPAMLRFILSKLAPSTICIYAQLPHPPSHHLHLRSAPASTCHVALHPGTGCTKLSLPIMSAHHGPAHLSHYYHMHAQLPYPTRHAAFPVWPCDSVALSFIHANSWPTLVLHLLSSSRLVLVVYIHKDHTSFPLRAQLWQPG